jgi:effector-binding domain-containing protein
MLYKDDIPRVEIGVELSVSCPLSGDVIASELPSGLVATTTHRGNYSGLGDAHRAIKEWCKKRGKKMTGVRWEVYGPHHNDPEQLWASVYYLLQE